MAARSSSAGARGGLALRDLSEGRGADVHVRVGLVHDVEQVRELRLVAEPEPFGDMECLADRHGEALRSRAFQDADTGVADSCSPCRRRTKCVDVEIVAGRLIRRRVADQVRPDFGAKAKVLGDPLIVPASGVDILKKLRAIDLDSIERANDGHMLELGLARLEQGLDPLISQTGLLRLA